jgi:nitroreductase
MSNAHSIPEPVQHAIELAGRAPSIHNSQPWQFDVQTDRIDLYANYRRWLPATDADQRDLLLSCGAALHHLRLALAAADIGCTAHRLPSASEPDLLASLQLTAESGSDLDRSLVAMISKRRTDRRPFRRWPVPESILQKLVDRAAEQGAVLRVVGDPRARETLVAAFAEAGEDQSRVAGYADELSAWTGTTGGDEGVPAENLLRTSARSVEAAREFGPGQLSAPPGDAPEEATLMVLGAGSDDRLSQLRAGEALSAVLLEATRLELASCPLSQPLEVRSTREVLRDDVLGGTLSPQVVVRLGWPGSDVALSGSPRRPVAETIGRLPQ